MSSPSCRASSSITRKSSSGQRVLRNMGKGTFVITPDVTRCLQRAGLDISANPASKRELALVQAAFNAWHGESALPYSHMSRICACSID